eukprot:TRINITY_DN23858_c0_g1_i1.p1 TRINITY_DN23858_c0_g1~~TRINITY_DN23858_c0_g1_i1.p1  ORF type:complete len:234 (-),score=51.14 TRINITY_DN23858_c0_g1_i1:108-809(-)
MNKWLRSVIRFHSATIITNGGMLPRLTNLLAMFEKRTAALPKIIQLQGKIDMVLDLNRKAIEEKNKMVAENVKTVGKRDLKPFVVFEHGQSKKVKAKGKDGVIGASGISVENNGKASKKLVNLAEKEFSDSVSDSEEDVDEDFDQAAGYMDIENDEGLNAGDDGSLDDYEEIQIYSVKNYGVLRTEVCFPSSIHKGVSMFSIVEMVCYLISPMCIIQNAFRKVYQWQFMLSCN